MTTTSEHSSYEYASGIAFEHNYSRVLRHLYHHRIDTRANIAKTLRLTPAAVSKITARLLAVGILKETGNQQGSKNRRSIGLTLNAHQFHILGIAVGEHHAEIASYDLFGHSTIKAKVTIEQNTHPDLVTTLITNARAFIEDDPSIIAIGFTQPVWNADQLGTSSSTSSLFPTDTYQRVQAALNKPIFFNDTARAGAIAQYLFPPLNNAGNQLVYCLIDEHITMGVIENNHLLHSADNMPARIGHVSIDVNGRQCSCGNRGCLEQYCSTRALHQQAIEQGILPHNTSHTITDRQACRMIFDLARSGNQQALHLVTQIGSYIGYACVTILNIFNPETIVIGGAIAQGGSEALIQAISNIAVKRTPAWMHASETITLAHSTFDTPTCIAAATAVASMLTQPSILVPHKTT